MPSHFQHMRGKESSTVFDNVSTSDDDGWTKCCRSREKVFGVPVYPPQGPPNTPLPVRPRATPTAVFFGDGEFSHAMQGHVSIPKKSILHVLGTRVPTILILRRVQHIQQVRVRSTAGY